MCGFSRKFYMMNISGVAADSRVKHNNNNNG